MFSESSWSGFLSYWPILESSVRRKSQSNLIQSKPFEPIYSWTFLWFNSNNKIFLLYWTVNIINSAHILVNCLQYKRWSGWRVSLFKQHSAGVRGSDPAASGSRERQRLGHIKRHPLSLQRPGGQHHSECTRYIKVVISTTRSIFFLNTKNDQTDCSVSKLATFFVPMLLCYDYQDA